VTERVPAWVSFLNLWGLGLWVWLLGALVFFPPGIAEAFSVPSEVWLVGGAGVLACGAMLWRAARGWSLWPLCAGALVPVALLAVWVVVTSALALKPGMSAAYAVGVLALMALGVHLVAVLRVCGGLRDRLYALLGVLVAYQTVLGLMQYFRAPLNAWGRSLGVDSVFGHILYWYGAGEKGVPIGTLGNVNYLPELLCLTVPVLFGWALSRPSLRARWILVTALLAPAALLVATGCRAALFGLLVGGMAAWVLTRGGQSLHPRHWFVGKRRWGLTAAVVLGLVVVVGVMGDRLSQKLTLMDDSIEARLVNWRAAVAMVPEHPVIGTGLGGYQLGNVKKLAELYPEGLPDVTSGSRFYQAHQDGLQLTVELGIPGLLLVLWLGLVIVKALRLDQGLPLPERTGLLIGLLALAVASCFGFPLHIPVTAAALVVVLALALVNETQAEQSSAQGPMALRLALVVGLAAVFVWIGTRTVWPLYQSAGYQYLAEALEERERRPKGVDTIYGLAARLNRFGAPLIFDQLQALTRQKRYDEVIALYEQHVGDGLGMDATLLYGNAWHQLGRYAEARTAYERGLHYYHPEHPNYRKAKQRIEELSKDAVAGENAKPVSSGLSAVGR